MSSPTSCLVRSVGGELLHLPNGGGQKMLADQLALWDLAVGFHRFLKLYDFDSC